MKKRINRIIDKSFILFESGIISLGIFLTVIRKAVQDNQKLKNKKKDKNGRSKTRR